MPQLPSLLPKIFISTLFVLANTPAKAQITPDNTLGAEASSITPNTLINGANADLINGGAQRGGNLFHSFTEFNVGDGQRVYFDNPIGIQNILTRVTGGNQSNILGTLGVNGNANLFLINPNGIVFGQNASLDVRGSFVGTTANAVQFGNQGIFSATNPQAVPLLTVNPSALLFNQINQNATIQSNSVAPAGIDPAGFDAFGLRVGDGKSLLLVGGNVIIDAGELNAFGGRVELGGLAEPGNVNLLFDGDNLSLQFPENVARADVSLTNQSLVFVQAAGGGDITINARNLEILGSSGLFAGIGVNLGTPETVAGDIILNTTGEIEVADSKSGIFNLVRREGNGNGGNIIIDAGSLLLRDGAYLQASTFGKGTTGDVIVGAKDAVSLSGNAYILSTVEAGGVGKSGNIDINAATLSLTDGSRLLTIIKKASATQPAAQGDAGNVNVKATGAVDIVGKKNNILSGVFSYIDTGTIGNGGNITIDAGSFSLRDGAQLSAATLGQGNAGNVTLRTKDAISLSGSAYILSTVEAGGVGKGGNIDINAATLSITEAAQILSVTLSAFNNQPAGRGDAGNVNVKVTGAVDIAGAKNTFFSGIFSAVDTGAVGNGGNIIIDAGSLSLRDGGQLAAATLGQGNAGNVTLRTKDAISLVDSSILSTVDAGSVGKGGNIEINAATLSLTEGSQLVTITRGVLEGQPAGNGDAGNVNVKVTGAVDIAGEKQNFVSGIFSAVDTGTVGNGGNIIIDAGSFLLRDGGQLTASTSGEGNAGTIKVNAADFLTISGESSNFTSGLYVNSASATGTAGDIIVSSPKITLDNQGTLKAESLSGDGGSINVNSDLLLLRRGSQISTNAGTQQQGGDGGNININSTFIVAVPNENSDITANAFSGAGGNINILTESIFGIEARLKPSELTNDITASSELGVQGQIAITQPEVQPTQALIELPSEVVDASQQIAQTCPRSPNAKPLGKFIVTGRGSLPPSPLELMTGTNTQIPLATLEEPTATQIDKEIIPVSHNTSSDIIEAQGLMKTADGQIALVAHAPQATASSRLTAAVCPVANGLSH